MAITIVRLDLGAIAQLGERYTGSVEVGGSIPPGSTNLTTEEDATTAAFFVCGDNRTRSQSPAMALTHVRCNSVRGMSDMLPDVG